MADSVMDSLIREAKGLAITLLQQMGELAKMLQEEMSLVQTNQIEALAALTKQKNGLINNYQSTLKNLSGRQELLQAMPDDLRSQLKTQGNILAEVTEQNAILLQGAVRASARLVQNIFAMIKEEALPRQGYVNPQQAALQAMHYSPTAPSVLINRTA